MTERNLVRWRWADLNPFTRVMMAAFSGEIGNRPNQLPIPTFVTLMTEAFAGQSQADLGREDVTKRLGYFGLPGTRNAFFNRLGLIPREEVGEAVETVGRLAGDTPGLRALTELVSREIQIYPANYDLIPPLQVLAELAFKNNTDGNT